MTPRRLQEAFDAVDERDHHAAEPGAPQMRCGANKPHSHAGMRVIQISLLGACFTIHYIAFLFSFNMGGVDKYASPARLVFQSITDNVPPKISYEHTFLDSTSMWAMGVDARTVPPHRKHVPLVSWNAQAVERVRAEWVRLQWFTPCTRAMYIYPHSWGITSQMRDFVDAAFVALAFGRPLRVVNKGAPKARWCKEDAWLECFFEPLAGPSCVEPVEHGRVKRFRPQALKNGSAVPDARRVFSGPQTLLMTYDARFTFILDEIAFFPINLWETMIADGLVLFHDAIDHRIDANHLRIRHPAIFHTISVSALRTMLTSVIFSPRPHILAEANLKLKHSKIEPASCIAVHLRLTDKYTDGGIAANLKRDLDYVPLALDRIRKRIGRLPSCMIVLTDDDRWAVPVLETMVGSSFKIAPLTRASTMFGPSLAEYETYAKMGHNFFLQEAVAWPHQQGRAFDYFRSAIVDAIAASHGAKVFIGMGSSGLSQLICQLMGFYEHVDANAFAVWQEDIVAHSSLISDRA